MAVPDLAAPRRFVRRMVILTLTIAPLAARVGEWRPYTGDWIAFWTVTARLS